MAYVEGKLRRNEGYTKNVKYLIVGKGHQTGHLVLYDEEKQKIVGVLEQGKSLKFIFSYFSIELNQVKSMV